jgi:hypothetical protein
MKYPVLVRSWALLIATAGSMFCADAIRWGTAVDGLRLGIVATSAPEPGLRILLKNASTVAQEVPIGFQEHDPLYNVRFTVQAPRGVEVEVLDFATLRYKPSDMGPGPTIFAWLEPGGVQEFTYPLSQLFAANGADTPIGKFLKQGYTVRAVFQYRETAVASPELPLRR